MIQYALKCSEGHTFDSWFQSAEAFDKLLRADMVSCAICGGTDVEKAIMTPRVSSATRSQGEGKGDLPEKGSLSRTETPLEQAIARMRRHVEKNADYVGGDFAAEARRMHLGEAPERSIYGEARAEEAKALLDEGVPVAPLPFMPNRKSN
ncbi:DUF1178 family protein [Lutimaribacter marinistellae]|uniref:DUF1178 family protein n=1 Tax=Lutimaribacter marinistellae TaxID=1820329 RepID=A0ABV7TN99_9RHOB